MIEVKAGRKPTSQAVWMGLISIGWWHHLGRSGWRGGGEGSVFGEGNQCIKAPAENQLQEHCKGHERW